MKNIDTEGPEQKITTQKLKSLKDAILDSKPPYCAGVLPLQPEDLVLYYGKEETGSLGRIDFSNVNDATLEHLSNTCDKAMFGRNNEDVLDESYRKSGKLDSISGLMNIVRYDLLQGGNSHRPIEADLYKLNVYGKDAFFKAHKDTPRGTTMFGSLVLVLPTQNEGGALILRHQDQEWTFDSAKALSEAPAPQAHIGYIAFFSDVEHEVALGKLGYRVTITYNLYYDDNGPTKSLEATKTLPPNESAVTSALGTLLEDATFLPDGGHLGFGLNHEYPMEIKRKRESAFDFIARNLKGSDAVLMKACQNYKIDARLYLYFEDDEYDGRVGVIVPHEVDMKWTLIGSDSEMSAVWKYLREERGAHLISFEGNEEFKVWDIDFPVHWVTEKAEYNALKTEYMAYGNESSIEYMYGRFCLIVKVGPAGNRATHLE